MANREIKFRVWNGRTMTYPEGPEAPFTVIRLGGKVVDVSYGELMGEEEHSVLLQYTGYKDSDGKDIYEGDIVKETWKENSPYGYRPEEWDDEEDIYAINYVAPSFIFRNRWGDQTSIEDFKRAVIGNIYENPELL